MTFTNHPKENISKTVIEVSIKLILVLLLIIWCIMILMPFLNPVLWAVIIAIALNPFYSKIRKRVGGRKKLAALLFTLLFLLIILLPGFWLMESLVDGIISAGKGFRNGTFNIPPPGDQLEDWPLLGNQVNALWQSAYDNLGAFIEKYKDSILKVGTALFDSMVTLSIDLIMFVASIVIAGVLLIYSDEAAATMRTFFVRLMGESGNMVNQTIVKTIRNVAKGILLVSILQALLAGTVFALAGVPYPGLWAFLLLILAIIQLSPSLVTIPVIVYLYSVQEPLLATIWAIILLIISFSDNLLKPWFMGKGSTVPTLVIFIGAMGGLIMMGFVGLFTGAIILTIGYELFILWLNPGDLQAQEDKP